MTKENGKLKRILESTQKLYEQSKLEVFALLYLKGYDSQESYAGLRRVFRSISSQSPKICEHETATLEVLRRAHRMLPDRMGKSSEFTANERIVGYFRDYLNYSFDAITRFTGLNSAQCISAYENVKKNPDNEQSLTESYHDINSVFYSRDEWANIESDIQVCHNKGERITKVLLALVLAALLFVVIREAVLFIRVLCLPTYAAEDGILYAQSVIDEQNNDVILPSKENSAIAQSLYDQLLSLEPETRVRVCFAYYDEEAVNCHQELLDLYCDMFAKGKDAGMVDTIILRCISEYYATYEQPWNSIYREWDFDSPYADYYSCVNEYADEHARRGNRSMRDAIDRHPEVFADAQTFEAYLTSEVFKLNFAEISELVEQQIQMDAVDNGTLEMSKEGKQALRDELENNIYAFFTRYNGRIMADDIKYTSMEEYEFMSRRSELASQMEEALAASIETFGFDALQRELTSDWDMSVYSAVISVRDIFSLSKDGRFFFKGLAYKPTVGHYANIEPRLAQMIEGRKFTQKVDVYRIDNRYYPLYANYMITYTLPQAFVQQVQEACDCKHTSFEALFGYGYKSVYCHKENVSRYALLRGMLIHRDQTYTSTVNKNVSRLAIKYN